MGVTWMMQKNSERFTVSNDRMELLLVLLALFAPSVAGFQYLEWISGNSHFTFMLSSILWNLTYSDWYTEYIGAVNGWLFGSAIGYLVQCLFNSFLVDIFWAFGHINPTSLLFVLLTPIVRIIFAVGVVLCRQNRISKSVLAISGIGVIGISLASCFLSMTVNVIYGTRPGWCILLAPPNLDTRLFVPIPILLLVGLYLSRKAD